MNGLFARCSLRAPAGIYKEADIRKATDALAKLDGELRRKHPVTSKPRREMVDELVALGFEEERGSESVPYDGQRRARGARRLLPGAGGEGDASGS